MSGPNAILDLESAPVTAFGLPGSHVEHTTFQAERDKVIGATGNNAVTVGPAGADDEDEEPTDEEYATMRK